MSRTRTKRNREKKKQKTKQKARSKISELENGVVRGKELVVPFHDAFHIAQFQLVDAVELFDDLAVLVPVVGSAGPEDVDVRWRRHGRRLRGESHGRRRERVHDDLKMRQKRDETGGDVKCDVYQG